MSERGGSDLGAMLEAVASGIDRVTEGVGRVVAWLTFATVVVVELTFARQARSPPTSSIP